MVLGDPARSLSRELPGAGRLLGVDWEAPDLPSLPEDLSCVELCSLLRGVSGRNILTGRPSLGFAFLCCLAPSSASNGRFLLSDGLMASLGAGLKLELLGLQAD